MSIQGFRVQNTFHGEIDMVVGEVAAVQKKCAQARQRHETARARARERKGEGEEVSERIGRGEEGMGM